MKITLTKRRIYYGISEDQFPFLRDLFIEQLEHLILSGKLPVGEKLPPERQLAEMMQVSRAVVNSGISELEKKGFSP